MIDNRLVATCRNQYYEFDDTGNWKLYKEQIYSKKSPKLFENDKYISFSACHGEFGGQIFFIEKATQKIYTIPSTCATSIIYHDNKYLITSSLGHMFGSAEIFSLYNPNDLIEFNGDIDKIINIGISYDDFNPPIIEAEFDTIFNRYGLQIFSTFLWKDKILNIVHWNEITFIAECVDDEISIIDPLFNNEIYTHNPITIQYSNDLVLINMDFYGIGGEKEVACIILYEDEIIKINWTEEFN